MRQMKLEIDGMTLYESSFDPETGTIVRAVEAWSTPEVIDLGIPGLGPYTSQRDNVPWEIQQKLRDRFPRRWDTIPSPSPELIDVSITNKCGFGCDYCYQDSIPKAKYVYKDLVPTLLKGLDVPPYQIAIGGGEPTIHPDFVWILEQARKLGTVPNYTTAGHAMTKKVIEATNRLCGGVAMTYHAFKGLDWFTEHYKAVRRKLTCQVNVHLIADNNAPKALDDLAKLQNEVGPINLVLLAYYPDVGRASMKSLMTRSTYSRDLPVAITRALNSGMKIAFSEGLLPFFLSRPEIGVDTRFAIRSEGAFSCYVGPDGRMSQSSFAEPWGDNPTIWKERAQTLWEKLSSHGGHPHGEACYSCPHASRCAAPHKFHYLTCAFASHNKLPLTRPEPKPPSRYDILMEDDDA